MRPRLRHLTMEVFSSKGKITLVMVIRGNHRFPVRVLPEWIEALLREHRANRSLFSISGGCKTAS